MISTFRTIIRIHFRFAPTRPSVCPSIPPSLSPEAYFQSTNRSETNLCMLFSRFGKRAVSTTTQNIPFRLVTGTNAFASVLMDLIPAFAFLSLYLSKQNTSDWKCTFTSTLHTSTHYWFRISLKVTRTRRLIFETRNEMCTPSHPKTVLLLQQKGIT